VESDTKVGSIFYFTISMETKAKNTEYQSDSEDMAEWDIKESNISAQRFIKETTSVKKSKHMLLSNLTEKYGGRHLFERPGNITMPTNFAPSPWISESELEHFERQEEPTNVLVVDDSIVNNFAFRELLFKKFKIPSSEAFNGEHAVKKVLARKENKQSPFFKVIFMDLNMPIMNGYDAARHIKNIDKRSIIVAVTVTRFVENVDGLFTEVLNKPVSMANLKASL